MPQKTLEILQIPSFVRLRTAPQMRKFAMKMAQIKKAVSMVKKLEMSMLNENLSEEQVDQKLKRLTFFADYARNKTQEAIDILTRINGKVERYRKLL